MLRLYRYRVLFHDIVSTVQNIERFTYSPITPSASQSAALHKAYLHCIQNCYCPKPHNKFHLFANKGGCSNRLRLVLTATSRGQSYTMDISSPALVFQQGTHTEFFVLCTVHCDIIVSFKATKCTLEFDTCRRHRQN
jgi:hypothetical protein